MRLQKPASTPGVLLHLSQTASAVDSRASCGSSVAFETQGLRRWPRKSHLPVAVLGSWQEKYLGSRHAYEERGKKQI